MKKASQLSVFFPAYNEEKNIKATVVTAVRVLKKIAEEWEILVINDGSTDKTRAIVEKLSKKYKQVRLINHPQNRGYGAALKTGLFSCQYPLICYTDSDGQFDFREIDKFLARIKTSDLVIGYRISRSDRFYRRLLAKILWLVNLILFGLNVKDVDCGFKLFKKRVVDKIGNLKTESAITETEFMVRATKLGFKISQVGVKHAARLDGEQTGGKFKIIFKAGLEGLKLWWGLQKKFFLKLFFWFGLLSLAAFLRFYRLEDLMVYLGDEGRDMLVVMDILKGKNFPLIGPRTSVGNLYLGPLYYYMITPFVWFFKMEPLGPAVFVALLGVVTVPLFFFIVKKLFNQKTALFSTILYLISPLVIEFSRSSWNPNPMPFFCLILMLLLYFWYQTKKPFFLYSSVVCFALMLQLHYIIVLLIPYLIFLFYRQKNQVGNSKDFWRASIILLLLLSPLVIFDLTHNFVNLRGFAEILQGRSNQGFNIFDVASRARDRLRQIIGLFFAFPERSWPTNLMALGFIFVIIKKWREEKEAVIYLVFGWFIWSIFSLGFYRESFYPHYFGFLFPFPAIFAGHAIEYLSQQGRKMKLLAFVIFFALVFNSLKASWAYLSRASVLNVNKVKMIVRLIERESEGRQFNFSLLANNNYDDSYRYFFQLWGIPVVYKKEVADQLFVVCEDEEVCHPFGNPKWEIALFDVAYEGEIEIKQEWQPDPQIRVIQIVPK